MELDPVILDLARDYFDFRENEHLKVFSSLSPSLFITSILLGLCCDGEISVSGRHHCI